MRRGIALLALAPIWFSLIPAAVFAEAAPQVPACCRRDGRHHCSGMSGGHGESAGAALAGFRMKCPLFPAGKATPASAAFVAASNTDVFVAPAEASFAGAAQTEARYRLSYNRSRQKRGPPSLL